MMSSMKCWAHLEDVANMGRHDLYDYDYYLFPFDIQKKRPNPNTLLLPTLELLSGLDETINDLELKAAMPCRSEVEL